MPDDRPAPPPARRGPRSRRRTWQLRAILLVMGLGFALAVAEIGLQLAPRALPTAFRERYPPHGIEFFDRGVLDRTPLTAVPLPYGVEPYDGPPPADLVDAGVATAEDAEADRRDVPRLVVPADGDGLPNDPRPERPDVVLVGDSFTLYASQQEPEGLQRTLEQQLRASFLNLGIAGIGPDQELWLLENVGLPARPRVVVWLLFGGNDVLDAYWCRHNLAQGITTYGQLHADKRAPRLLLPNLIASWLAGPQPRAATADPLPPARIGGEGGAPLWLFPDAIRQLSVPPAMLQDNPGVVATRDVLRRAKQAVADAGARLLVVFLPCKEQVYLPQLAHDAPLLHRYAGRSSLYGIPMADDPQQFLATLQANHTAIERAIQALCAADGIPYWSATPALIEAARRGEPVYYRTDTHWRAEGQRAIAADLAAQLVGLGLERR